MANNSQNRSVSRNSEQPFFILDTRRFDHDLYSDDLKGSSKNSFIEFVIVFTSCIDRYPPLRLVSRRKRKLIKKKRRSQKIFASIRRKQKLYVSHFSMNLMRINASTKYILTKKKKKKQIKKQAN